MGGGPGGRKATICMGGEVTGGGATSLYTGAGTKPANPNIDYNKTLL